ncbi:unnamed protein product [Linum tenue]|uniref:S-protein homolog n=1 Tax=Linum tenue TaxID=586396 RepID=A0AAV0IGC1_9ROSI|nr:unnamed protein product [Linum tenue]
MLRVAVVFAALMILQARPSIQHRIVSVENELRGRKVIVHCRSKDDDIGANIVDVGSRFEWGFEPNTFGKTLYWCRLAVRDRRLSFDAYDGKTDHLRGHDVRWLVREDGVHLVDPDGTLVESFHREWNKLWVDRI